MESHNTIGILSYKRIDRLRRSVDFYYQQGITPIICDSTPPDMWNQDDIKYIKERGLLHLDPKLSFHQKFIWLANFLNEHAVKILTIAPDEDVFLKSWLGNLKDIEYKRVTVGN